MSIDSREVVEVFTTDGDWEFKLQSGVVEVVVIGDEAVAIRLVEIELAFMRFWNFSSFS